MIASVVLQLQSKHHNAPPSARDVQGVFFSIAAQTKLPNSDHTIADIIHNANTKPKPYTTAWGQREHPYMRLTLLSPQHYGPLSPALYGLLGENLRIGQGLYRVQDVLHEHHPRARLTTHQHLLQSSNPNEHEITLDFMSPTTFKRGEMIVPLPEPKLVFYQLIEKWNMGSPTQIDASFMPWLEANVTVSRANIKTRLVDTGYHKMVAFAGRVSFASKDKDPMRLRQFGALARFTFFAGVGYKTTLGFGQTRCVPNANAQPPND